MCSSMQTTILSILKSWIDGLRAVTKMRDVIKAMTDLFDANVPHDLDELDRHVPMIDEIESFWRNPLNQQARSWLDHGDINSVMLAISLLPEEFLSLDHVV